MSKEEPNYTDLNPVLFKNPTAQYRAAPFWAWNCKLNKEQLLRQIDQMNEMGMGGFHIHCRVGLDTEYLGDEYFDCVKSSCSKAKKLGMLCRLYDEDRWPSGSAGGIVTKDQKYRSRFLTLTPRGYVSSEADGYMSAAKAIRSENRTYLGSYDIELDEEGCLKSYCKIPMQDQAKHKAWDAYLEVSGDTPWFNNQAYVNTMDKKAIDRFIEVTHEKYYKEIGEEFGKQIPTIFTDEPQTCHKTALRDPFEEMVVILPFADDFEESFLNAYGVSLLEHLPELLWELKGQKVSQVRYWYHVHVCERFSEAFGDNIGQWCNKHHLKLTGHMMNEWTLYSQTLSAGDVMRPMKEFGLPGVDMLCDRRELSTVKQASSVAHQFGREGVMSELYGVTGWDFDFRNHKLAGDWQAALGVTLRVPHLTWVSMEGEAKRDYPASIGYQSPWYKKYSYIENHFARLNTALTRGKPIVRVGVIHPVESYWLYWGNQRQTSVVRQDLETNFTNIIDWLLYNLIDFDFISESILSTDDQSCADGFHMGEMTYQTVVVPECHTLRKTTMKKLQEFEEHGGKVIFMGDTPKYVDALPDEAPASLAVKCLQIPFRRGSLLQELQSVRDLDVETVAVEGTDPSKVKQWENGVRANNLFYQLRQDGADRWLFISHVNRPQNQDVTFMEKLNIRIHGEYQPVLYDTMTGDIHPVHAEYENGWTCISHYCSQHDSILLQLKKEKQAISLPKVEYVSPCKKQFLPESSSFQLEEKNALVLDMAEYAFDDGIWNGKEEILRIDNLFRKKLGYPLRMEALAQPWTEKEEKKPEHTLRLRFTIHSDVAVPRVYFAMERPENAGIIWNRKHIPSDVTGWYVDESIQTVILPNLLVGDNLLELEIPFARKTNVEWSYLLGDFGAEVCGKEKHITSLPISITYGDFVHQGLPFYAGNLIYKVPFTCEAGELHLEVPQYRGALVQVELDGKDAGIIALAPYRLNCGQVSNGAHTLRLKVFGNRINAFGALHNADETEEWYGPNLWRTEGNKWSYEYRFKQMGVLTTPEFWIL